MLAPADPAAASASPATARPARSGVAGPLRAAILAGALVALAGCGGDRLRQPDEVAAAQYNAQLGANYLRRGELNQARAKLESALSQDDDNALAHATYAQLQQRIGDPEQARFHFERAIELQPDEAEHHNAFGAFLCDAGDLEAAQREFAIAASDPYYATPEFALDNAGLCMLSADDLPRAETYLRAALRSNPRFPAAWLHMADYFLRTERLTLAGAYFQRYETLGPRTPESLLLGHRIARDAGDVAAAERYASALLGDFPASREAGEYLSRATEPRS